MSYPDAQTWCHQQKQKLKQNDSRPSALHDIKDLLSSLPALEASTIVRGLDVPQLIQCVETSDKKQIDTACEVLGLCFANLTIGVPVRSFASDIRRFLSHENASVRLLAVNEVHKTIVADPGLLLTPQVNDIVVAIVPCLGDSDLRVSTKVMDIIANVDVLKYPQVLKEIKHVLEGNTSAKCNGYEVIVNISSKSPVHLEKCIEEGYIQSFVSQLSGRDVLYQLNILELLSKFALTTHGLNYLIEHDILKELAAFVLSLEAENMGTMLMPGLIKFFGSIAHIYPKQILEQFPIFVNSLFENINSVNNPLLPVSLDTLGFIGSTIEGKLSLGALGHFVPTTLNIIGGYIQIAPTDIRVRALSCLTRLIAVETDANLRRDGPIDHRVTLMTREWFRGISEHPSAMEILVSMCKIPFPDLKLASMGVLDAVCQHQWGEELVARTPGFLEFLLNRSYDYTSEVRLMKWEILKRLSKSASFDADVIMKLKKYVEEGPYFVEAMAEVAIEGE